MSKKLFHLLFLLSIPFLFLGCCGGGKCKLQQCTVAPQKARTSLRVPLAEKKIIHFGWVAPFAPKEFLECDLADLDSTCPFDGIGLYAYLDLKRDGKVIQYRLPWQVGAPQMLTEEDFQELIPAYLRLQQTRLKHNFIRCNSALFNADWFDEEGWKRTLNNYSMLAWLAKQTKCEGMCFDIEAYEFTGQPFRFRPELGHSFEETAAQVRKRGKEWIQELNRQYPNLTLFTFHWTSQCVTPLYAEQPELLNFSPTGLQIAFINGIYDGAPETMKIIDGNETPGYRAENATDYDRILANATLYGDAWIDDANKEKFHKITSTGVSLYLDRYANRDFPTDNHVQLLATNIGNCIRYTDEYVWVWCEKGNFWPKICKSELKFWNEQLPHCTDAIEFGRNISLTDLRKNASSKNLLKNSSLDALGEGEGYGPGHEPSPLVHWGQWQSSHSPQGTITAENGMVRLVNVTEGCIAQAIDVKQGQQFIVTARCKVEGAPCNPSLGFFFRNSKGTGLWDIQCSIPFTIDLGDGWMGVNAPIIVPSGRDIKTLTITVGTGVPKQIEGDKGVLFDDIELHPVEFPWQDK